MQLNGSDYTKIIGFIVIVLAVIFVISAISHIQISGGAIGAGIILPIAAYLGAVINRNSKRKK